MIARYPVYRERLASEWGEVRRAAGRAIHALDLASRNEDDASVYLDSAALNLHAFYNGLERIFEWLARQIDNTIPEGASWHRDLLAQMSLSVNGLRPAVINRQSKLSLQEFLGFRHLVRNTYTWDLDAAKVNELVKRLPDLLQMLDSDFSHFEGFLESAAHADESD